MIIIDCKTADGNPGIGRLFLGTPCAILDQTHLVKLYENLPLYCVKSLTPYFSNFSKKTNVPTTFFPRGITLQDRAHNFSGLQVKLEYK